MTNEEFGTSVRTHGGLKYLLDSRKPFIASLMKKGKAFGLRLKEIITPIGNGEELDPHSLSLPRDWAKKPHKMSSKQLEALASTKTAYSQNQRKSAIR